MNRSGLLLSTVLSLVVANGCEGASSKQTGSEGGACYGNGTCDGELECRYGVCVGPSSVADVVEGTDPGSTPNRGEMVTVAGGSFWQGCNADVDDECNDREQPYHQVTVPAFEIDKYEVTVGLYNECFDPGNCSLPDTGGYCNWGVSGREDHPVNCVTWDQARKYCAWAGKRLCSESEWEKAARGTDGRKYPWGDEAATCEYAVMWEGGYGCGTDSTRPVGSKPAGASPYGAHDMSGNVWEWVEDDWHPNYTGAPTNGSAWVDDPRASRRVLHGGGFYYHDFDTLRSVYRASDFVSDELVSVGIRCCRSL